MIRFLDAASSSCVLSRLVLTSPVNLSPLAYSTMGIDDGDGRLPLLSDLESIHLHRQLAASSSGKFPAPDPTWDSTKERRFEEFEEGSRAKRGIEGRRGQSSRVSDRVVELQSSRDDSSRFEARRGESIQTRVNELLHHESSWSSDARVAHAKCWCKLYRTYVLPDWQEIRNDRTTQRHSNSSSNSNECSKRLQQRMELWWATEWTPLWINGYLEAEFCRR